MKSLHQIFAGWGGHRRWPVLLAAGFIFLALAGRAHAQSTDYLYFSNSFTYDAASGAWYDGDWNYCDAPYDPGALTGGQDWDGGYVLNGNNYAYDYYQSIWYVSSDGGYTWSQGDEPSYPHVYLYYTDLWAYDEVTGTWYDETLYNPDFWDGTWEPADPWYDYSGYMLLGGDDFQTFEIDGVEYAQDTYSGNWYVFNSTETDSQGDSDVGGWDATTDPSPPPPSLIQATYLNVSGGLSTDTTTVYWWNGTGYEDDSLYFPDLSAPYANLVTPGSSPGFNSLSVTSDTWVGSDLTLQGALFSGGNGLTFLNGSFNYQDLGGNTGAIAFNNEAEQAQFLWQQNGGWSTPMSLDSRGRLAITEPTSGNSFIFNPAEMEIDLFAQPLGTARVHLQDVDASSALMVDTQGMAGGTGRNYLQDSAITFDASDPAQPAVTLGATTMSYNPASGGLSFFSQQTYTALEINPGDQSITLANGFSIGGNSTMGKLQFGGGGLMMAQGRYAVGNGAFNMGGNAAVGGNFAMAFGGTSGNATGNGTMSFQNGQAEADNAFALGVGPYTRPFYFGSYLAPSLSFAGGFGSVAWGMGSIASTAYTVVVGHQNQPITGDAAVWQATSPAFIVGTGSDWSSGGTTIPNGLVVYNNGNATVNGALTVAPPAYVSPTSTSQPPALQVNGASVLNGSALFSGNVFLSQAPGDVPMGGYGN